ncbi:tRNA (N6-threonylcarbamoyladenosine(37)-N6)-methyltransferase TrmO [Thermococcus sp. MV5]|uniref:tRNA (N6-threonylcarbamoyladenosine(37)-N6)-methyltransferase TrmO n=1 Tax=Thermococcus sp. MV5 TaxID=1638272 RepID=UPI00143957A3|nr:tRNA (N6-threonylcarbamoyladenosine(37)-N6)-methyltransferase TrmO [Thermococcus sp. MV5]NJE25138.1 tRNA (N6-threonylcarbamoyladenosine(37)-N6)-methyltransferase TrmO [Thermococcus sp. MV5]
MEKYKLIPIGRVHKDSETFLEIYPEFAEALEGLNEGDWIKLILWFHESDTPEKRKILKVHPYSNPENPLKGVFATRSPVRPNPLAIYALKIHRLEGNRIYIDWIDANDGTPIVDIKILVERLDCPREVSIKEQELDIPLSRQVGEINLIPRKTESLDKLEEIDPEKYNALVLELGSKTTTLTVKELAELIKALKEFYDELPREIRVRF